MYQVDELKTILSIGPYFINMISMNKDYKESYLPETVAAFLHNGSMEVSDKQIQYSMEYEGLELKPEDIILIGLDEGPMPYKIYQRSNGEYIWVRMNYNKQVELAYCISKDWKYWRLLEDNTRYHGSKSFAELAYIFPYSILNMEGIMFHGVVMEWRGMGIIVCANSGVGKTTHTRMWRDYENAQILNGDRALCYKEQGTWYTCGSPWNGSSGEYQNRSVKISAMVLIEQAIENHITPLSPLNGALELIRVTFAPAWEESLMNCAIDHINDIVETIPVFKLMCRPDMEAVATLKSILETHMNRQKASTVTDY